jgi:acyl transferase domain-containing protein
MMAAGLMPDLTLGVSLGTWAAAVVSGCIERSVAMAMVMHQARVFEQYCAPGGMIAVLGDPALYDDPALSEHAALAGINFNGSFVLAAPAAALAGIEAYLRDRACPFQRLAVGYPFHSHWIDPARAPLAAATDALPVAGPTRLPLACCAAGAVLHELPDGHFWDVARQPIRLRDTIAALEHEGPFHYVDAGPSSTLAGTLKYALAPQSRSSSYPVMSPFGDELANLTRVSALRP